MDSDTALNRLYRYLAAASLLALLLSGCAAPERPAPLPPTGSVGPEAPPPSPKPAPPAPPPAAEARADESLVLRAYRKGDYQGVVSEFEKMLRRYPSHAKGADDLYYLGMSYFQLDRNALSLKTLLELQYRFHNDPRVAEVHLAVAKLFRRLGNPERSFDSLRQAIHLAPDGALRLEAWVEKADILAGQGRYLESLSVLDEAYRRSEPAEREKALMRIRDLLRVMPAETVARSVLPGSYSFPREEGERILAARGEEESFFLETAPPAATGTVEAGERRLVKIGVLTPSAGRLEAYGREVTRGVELLLETAAREGFPYDVEAVFMEEGAESDEEFLVAEAIRSDDILVVIGPLLSGTVEKIVLLAERESLPLLSPTASAARLNGISPGFFRNCLTLEESGKALADLAVNLLGLRTFVIFTPDDAYGYHYADIFQREVSARGGEVLAVQEYDVELTDFAKPIKSLKKKANVPDRPTEKEKAGGSGEGGEVKEEEYVLPFEAVFLPGSAEEVGLILPQFAFHDMDTRLLTVLGGSGLNTLRFPEVGEEFAEGAIFTDGFFAGSPRPEVQRFVRDYRRRYGEDPGTFAAQAYDAAAMALESLRRGADTREKMLAALAEVEGFPGVAGSTTLVPGGLPGSEPFFGTVARGGLVSLEPLPGEVLSIPGPLPTAPSP
jgi:branched-chain amino acid transport system substrate-binding protein